MVTKCIIHSYCRKVKGFWGKDYKLLQITRRACPEGQALLVQAGYAGKLYEKRRGYLGQSSGRAVWKHAGGVFLGSDFGGYADEGSCKETQLIRPMQQ